MGRRACIHDDVRAANQNNIFGICFEGCSELIITFGVDACIRRRVEKYPPRPRSQQQLHKLSLLGGRGCN